METDNNPQYIPANAIGPNMRRSTYIPANVPGQQNMKKGGSAYIPASSDIYRFKRGLSWWRDDGFFKYPYLLVSAYYGIREGNDFRTKYNIPDDVMLITDSGGFQIVTQDKYINPIDVLRWQEAINSYAGLILDHPPYDIAPDTFFFGKLKDFELNMKRTAENTNIAYDNRKTDMELLGVIQGDTWDRLTKWFNAMNQNMDGWSIKPNPSYEPMKVAMAGAFAIENFPDKPLHILQVSGTNTMAIAVYITKYFKQQVTFDSSSYARGAMGREYLIPFSLSQKLIFGNTGHRVDILPCNCPVCSSIKPEELWGSGTIPGALISLHNLYWYITYSSTLQSLLKYDDLFMEFVNRICNKKTIQAIEYLDYYMDTQDIDRANARYSSYLGGSSGLTQERFRV